MRACYATPGTVLAYAAAVICLYVCYAMPGTDGRLATQCRVLTERMALPVGRDEPDAAR